MDGLIYVQVGKDNLWLATRVQETLFFKDRYVGMKNLTDSAFGSFYANYWLTMTDGGNIGGMEGVRYTLGISGIYMVECDNQSAWLGWFGVMKPYRRKGYATEMLKHFEDVARRRGYKYARLYTEHDNTGAKAFYEKNGYTCEPYECEEDPYPEKIDIYSKPLGDYPCPLWGNRNLNLDVELRAKNEKR